MEEKEPKKKHKKFICSDMDADAHTPAHRPFLLSSSPIPLPPAPQF